MNTSVNWPSNKPIDRWIPISSKHSLRAVSSKCESVSSFLPPGKLIWPLWLPSYSCRWVKTHCISSFFRKRITATADSRIFVASSYWSPAGKIEDRSDSFVFWDAERLKFCLGVVCSIDNARRVCCCWCGPSVDYGKSVSDNWLASRCVCNFDFHISISVLVSIVRVPPVRCADLLISAKNAKIILWKKEK